MREYPGFQSLRLPALLLSTYFLPRIAVVLAGCFGTASGFRPARAVSPTAFLLSFGSTPPLIVDCFRLLVFLVGDGGAMVFAAPFVGAGEIV